MPVIRVLVMLATMMMKLVKTAKEKKVFKNVGVSIMGITFWEAIKDSIKNKLKKVIGYAGMLRLRMII